VTNDSRKWIKSSYSGNGGSCVEFNPTQALATGLVPVRDSKIPDGGPIMSVPFKGWAAFVQYAARQEV
jgi:hypothetical protein